MLNKKRNKIRFILAGSFALLGFLPALAAKAASTGYFKYQLLEGIPGFFTKGQTMTDLPTLISAIYKFGIWTIGIAAMFMLVVGGFMYMTSAGNTSTARSAKDIITDALLGLAVALTAYLFLYVINPDLIKMNLNLVSVEVLEPIGPGPSTSGSGNCKPITTAGNPCSVDNLKKFAQTKGVANPEDWATKASSICNAESSGKTTAQSGGTCSGTPIALGLFQINLNVECKSAFDIQWSRRRTTDKNRLYDPGCKVINQTTYDKCKANAFDVNWNMEKMWSLYEKRGWQPWEVTLNGMCPKW